MATSTFVNSPWTCGCGALNSFDRGVCHGCGKLHPIAEVAWEASHQSRNVVIEIPRSRGIYIILAILFGSLGIHNIYAKRYALGAFQFALFVLTFWTLVVPLVVWLIALLEAALVSKDGDGKLM